MKYILGHPVKVECFLVGLHNIERSLLQTNSDLCFDSDASIMDTDSMQCFLIVHVVQLQYFSNRKERLNVHTDCKFRRAVFCSLSSTGGHKKWGTVCETAVQELRL